MPKVGEARDQGGTLLRKDRARPLVARMQGWQGQGQTKGVSHPGPIASNEATKALVNTGATHNFVSEDEVKRLKLQASKWKVVSRQLIQLPSHHTEVACGVAMHIGSWEGRVDVTIALMDDFKMVLGMDFLRKVKSRASTLPTLNGYLEEEKPCMVPTVTEGVTYLATVEEEKDDGSGEPMPKEIKGVLDEFKGCDAARVAQRLPPRREEDHKIELEPKVKPLAMAHTGWHRPSRRS
ncbi:hypothetical protein CK203_089259 [Vitis vinifera]|uniref:Uncharacterized protein n=1 Tax=Vitis vinifera TaxID=29760 RepID=A0A438D017_VITVI|nr:hypothetical protein CK203_089259 [Vitis vinifera]